MKNPITLLKIELNLDSSPKVVALFAFGVCVVGRGESVVVFGSSFNVVVCVTIISV